MDVRHCARAVRQLRSVLPPVIENDRVLGIVTYNELVFNGLCELIE